MKSIIDPPSPFAPASEWAQFSDDMRSFPADDVADMAYLAEPRENAAQDDHGDRPE